VGLLDFTLVVSSSFSSPLLLLSSPLVHISSDEFPQMHLLRRISSDASPQRNLL
jgi:hypothetical protein